MTASTVRRIARLYEKTIGYDPIAEGWTPVEALETLQEHRIEVAAAAQWSAPKPLQPTDLKAI